MPTQLSTHEQIQFAIQKKPNKQTKLTDFGYSFAGVIYFLLGFFVVLDYELIDSDLGRCW